MAKQNGTFWTVGRGLAAGMMMGMLAAGGAAAQDAKWDALVEAAKKEGSVVVYSTGAQVDLDRMAAAFTEKYGIAVESIKIPTDVMTQRLMAEGRSGNVQADVVQHSDPPAVDLLARSGFMEPLWGPDVDRSLPAGITNEYWNVITGGTQAILYRSDMANPPKDWNDIVAPGNKGRVAIGNGENSPTVTLVFYRVEEKIVDDFMTKLGALEPMIFDLAAQVVPLVAGGEVDIAFPVNHAAARDAISKGAKLTYLVPEPVLTYARSAGVMKSAPHPNAAMLFHNFTMSDEGQSILNSDERGVSFARDLDDDFAIGVSLDLWQDDVIGDPDKILAFRDHWSRSVRK